MNKSDIRTLFPHTQKGHIYLNHAAISPLNDRVVEAMKRFLANRNSGYIDNFEEWMEITEETRELIADLIHTGNPERISFMGNTSDALSAVAEGIEWNEGDEIILNSMEFPSNIHPFRILENRGVKLVYLSPDEEGKITAQMIEDAVTSETRLLSISAVQYLNGFRADLEQIGKVCRDHNLYFIVDGIQALGASNVDVQKCRIDALASGAHKWLMSPMGIGFLYLSERLASSLKPAKTGWLSVETPWDLSNYNQKWLPVSKHLETGTYNMAGIIGLHASLTHMMEIGVLDIENEIAALTDHLFSNVSLLEHVHIITPESKKHRAGIISFSLPGEKDADEVVNQLNKKQITISSREGFIRISPHYYNTTEELDRVLAAIF